MKLRGTTKEEHGLVAILDALGAANFGAAEVEQFLNARHEVLQLLHEKAEDLLDGPSGPQIAAAKISTFTFNDTIIITFRSGGQPPTLQQICSFLLVIRKFVVDSLAHGILFRGAVGAGRFHINDKTNTVMGEAVSDAAAWYEEAQWIGGALHPEMLTLHRLSFGADSEKNENPNYSGLRCASQRWQILPYENRQLAANFSASEN